MTVLAEDAGDLRSGKEGRDENFPVASFLIRPRHRPAILAFYRFVRTADDVADHAELAPADKLALLDRMRLSLRGEADGDRAARALRRELSERGLSTRHAEDLLHAFCTDVTKLRYTNWDELIGYCRYSAMPVGRFVLDVHGESKDLWPANDALCAALQIINHLQDCGEDYRNVDRVYVPLDMFDAENLGVESLGEKRASPALRRVLAGLARKTGDLLDQSRPFARMIRDRRLALEVAVIQRLAERLVGLLMRCDPLSENVHFSKAQALAIGLGAAARHALAARAPA